MSYIKKPRFFAILLFLENCAKYCLGPERNRNRNKNFSKVGTGTATNHYGPTTLPSSTLLRAPLLRGLPKGSDGWTGELGYGL
jgi:hypothetical protein